MAVFVVFHLFRQENAQEWSAGAAGRFNGMEVNLYGQNFLRAALHATKTKRTKDKELRNRLGTPKAIAAEEALSHVEVAAVGAPEVVGKLVIPRPAPQYTVRPT